MSDSQVQLFGAIIIAIISTIIGPSIFEWIKQKFFTPKKDTIKEDLEKNLVIDQELSDIREIFKADRVWITQFHNGGHFLITNKSIQKFSITYESTSPGVSSASQIFKDIPISLYTKAMNQILNNGEIFITDVNDPTICTFGLKNACEAVGTVSTYVISLIDIASHKCIGTLGMDFQEVTKLTHEQLDVLHEKSGRISGYLSVFLKK